MKPLVSFYQVPVRWCRVAVAALAVILCSTSVQARTIEWGSSVNDSLFDSDGVALDTTYIFELGSFGSFVPDFSNIEQWAANWKVFDRATFGSGTWSPNDGTFFSSADLLPGSVSSASPPLPSYTFGTNEQAYIWAFNTQTLAVNTTEWALVTNDSTDGNSLDDWKFPSASDHSVVPLQWRLPVTSHVIFGGLNDVQGPGDYTPPSTSYQLQTHTVSVVPEPGSALLIAVLGVLARLRRRTA